MKKSLLKRLLKSETIFYLAILLLPFENFVFAPSVGWATISPLLFGLYVVLNINRLWDALRTFKNIVLFFVAGLAIGVTVAILTQANLSTLVSSILPICLGGVELISFYIFYQKTRSLDKVINILVVAYTVTIALGFMQFMAVKTGNSAVVDFFDQICRRSYLGYDRVQFFFTEPSFIGMHIFGVLLPLYLLSKRKDLLTVIILYTLAAVLFGSGIRIIVDAFVVATLLAIYLIIKHKKYKIIPLALVSLTVIFFGLYTTNDRFNSIVSNGVYSDGSLASRYFRVQSNLIGYTKTFPALIWGFGLGNSLAPTQAGADTAAESYTNSYTKEVDEIRSINYYDDNITFSLELRMINEFGLIMFVIALIYLMKLAKNSSLECRFLYLAIILYSYIQFESYAFYAIWLFIVVMHFTKKTSPRTASPDGSLRVLVFGMNDNPGGVESFLMNYYRHIDRSKIHFDFLCNTQEVAYSDEIKKLGGTIYHITARSENRSQYRKELRGFFETHAAEYDVIWENVCSLANIDYLIYAEKYGIPRRIIHSHSSRNMDSKLRGLLHRINRHRIEIFATDFWACSSSAGHFFYPRRVLDSKYYEVVNNAIELEKYKFDNSTRNSLRKTLKVSDKKVLFNAGRFTEQKNQVFILELLKELVEEDKNYHLILAGDGEKRSEIESKIRELGLEKHVTLLGVRNDVEKLYQAADVLVFPSVFEGLSVTFLEAEAAGLPIVMSKSAITHYGLVAKYTYGVSLESEKSVWVDAVKKAMSLKFSRSEYSKSTVKFLTTRGFAIEDEAKNLEDLFTEPNLNVIYAKYLQGAAK